MGKSVKKNRIYLNAFFNVMALVAVIIMLVFCFYLFKLDMIPFKYLSILFNKPFVTRGLFCFSSSVKKLRGPPKRMGPRMPAGGGCMGRIKSTPV